MLIKNKFRGIPQKKIQIEAYEPEYKKLGLTPEIGSSVSIRASYAPRNVRVNSGQNEDLAWIPKQAPVLQPRNKVMPNNEVLVESVRERTFVNKNFEDGASNNVPISYDEVPEYTKSAVVPVQNDEKAVEFSDVPIGEFVLIFDNEILGAGTYDEVTAAIEEILLTDESGTVSPNSLIVLKRMQIMTGVLIKDG